MSYKFKAVTATLAVSALAVAAAPAAQAHGQDTTRHWTRTLSSQVVAPFQLALNQGKVYVADGATSMVSRVRSDGSLATVATGPQPGEVAGVDLDRTGRSVAYTWTNHATGSAGLTVKTKGKKAVTADLSGYEATVNPDGNRTYGITPKSDDACVNGFFEQATGGPATYKGIVESHPYAVASLGHGNWVVADAAGNDLLKVDARGHVSTLALLPRQPLKITAEIATNLGMPDCVVGLTYNFEPVPTDVEVDQHGMLWVSTLPGGPEDPSLGARGSVYRVNPWTGKAQRMATGFLGATNLAVARSGQVYVTELFAGRISTISHGKAKPFAMLNAPLSVEVSGDDLYAGTMAPMDENGVPSGMGSIVKIHR